MKQRVTIKNTVRGTQKMLLLDRETCRLSLRQARETFQELAVPGFEKAGKVGEWPFSQVPPECGGVVYTIVQAGSVEDGMSDLYFVPLEAADNLLRRLGAPPMSAKAAREASVAA